MSDKSMSPYATKDLLPEGRRRFLQFRESFLAISARNEVRAGILEAAFSKTGFLMDDWDLETKQEQHEVLLGPTPQAADTSVLLTDRDLLDRFAGMTTARSIQRAVNWLFDKNFIIKQPAESSDQRRKVIFNTGAIERELRALEMFNSASTDGREGTVWVTDSKTQANLPKCRASRLYQDLPAVINAAGRGSATPAAQLVLAAILLDRILFKATKREEEGDSIPAPWNAGAAARACGFGKPARWAIPLNMLDERGLITNVKVGRRTDFFMPNLERLREVASFAFDPDSASEVKLTYRHRTTDKSSFDHRQIVNEPPTDQLPTTDKSTSGELLMEGTLLDLFEEREGRPVPDRDSLLSLIPEVDVNSRSGSVDQSEMLGRFQGLSLRDFVDADPVQARRGMEVAEALRNRELSAVALFSKKLDRDRAIAACLLGHFADCRHIAPPLWLRPAVDQGVISGAHSDASRELNLAYQASNNALVIDDITQATHKQMRTQLLVAINGRKGKVPIIILGLPRTEMDVIATLGDPLGSTVLELLEQQRPVVKINAGGGGGEAEESPSQSSRKDLFL